MHVSRRSLGAAALVSSALFVPGLAAARQATPDAESGEESLPPEVIYETLRDSTFASPFTPSDVDAPSIEIWDDPNDTDLEGTIGGLIVQAGPDDDDVLGVYIVHPTVDQAASRLVPDENDEPPLDLFGFPVGWHQLPADVLAEGDEAYALIATRVGAVLISAIGQGGDPARNALRALANLSALLDHLLQTTAEPAS